MLFLVEYDAPAGETVSMRTYPDADVDRVNDERLAMELDLARKGVVREVVVLQAPTEAALRQTHARYFEGLGAIYRRLERSSSAAFLVRETED